MTPQFAISRAERAAAPCADPRGGRDVAGGGLVRDVAERLNPAVVNIDATSRGTARSRSSAACRWPDGPELFDRPGQRDPQGPRRGAGTGSSSTPAV